MLDNAIQHYWKIVVERIYHIVTWLGGRMHFAGGGKLADRNQQVMMSMWTLLEHCWKNSIVGLVSN